MIQPHSVYKHKRSQDWVLTDFLIDDDLVWCRQLTRDLNCPSGFVVEQHASARRIPRAVFESDWEFIKHSR